jgi:hypothetical protein
VNFRYAHDQLCANCLPARCIQSALAWQQLHAICGNTAGHTPVCTTSTSLARLMSPAALVHACCPWASLGMHAACVLCPAVCCCVSRRLVVGREVALAGPVSALSIHPLHVERDRPRHSCCTWLHRLRELWRKGGVVRNCRVER